MRNDPYPMYDTKLFREVWPSSDEFVTDFATSPFAGCLDMDRERLLYGLLFARHANDPLANLDEDQFKAKLFSIAFQYGPTWQKRLDIQARLRSLTEEELTAGSKAIRNHAANPSTRPSSSSLEELNYIDDQSTSSYKKSKMEAYAQLWDLLDVDVTGEFLAKFAPCFKTFAAPERPALYEGLM